MSEKKAYKIVVLDYHPIVGKGLEYIFNSQDNFEVVEMVSNGEELRRLLDFKEINTLFMDLKLPTTNIYRLIKDLIVTQKHIKIIAFTNYRMPTLVQNVMEFGVHAYLTKTVPVNEIIEAVRKVHDGEYFIHPAVYEDAKKVNEEEISHLNGNKLEKENFEKFAELTEREMDVVILLSRGYTNKEMAEKLFLSKYTVETHRRNLMKKLQFKTSAQLIYFAANQGLV